MQAALDRLEAEAYVKVLRCLTSKEFDWRKEKMLYELRKQLHVGEERHHLFLAAILEGRDPLEGASVPRQASPGSLAASDRTESVSTSSAEAPLPAAPPPAAAPLQPGAIKKRKAAGQEGPPGLPLPPPAPPGQLDPLIGRRVARFWPDEPPYWFTGVVTDCNLEGDHCIGYDLGTSDESFEWINIRHASAAEFRLLQGRVDVMSMPLPPTEGGGGGGGVGPGQQQRGAPGHWSRGPHQKPRFNKLSKKPRVR